MSCCHPGPYLADAKNNDSSILNHSIQSNTDDIKRWIQEEDVFVVDRGFRDSESLLQDFGINVQMQAFPEGSKTIKYRGGHLFSTGDQGMIGIDSMFYVYTY